MEGERGSNHCQLMIHEMEGETVQLLLAESINYAMNVCFRLAVSFSGCSGGPRYNILLFSKELRSPGYLLWRDTRNKKDIP